jgi:hypothetical protein
MDRMSGSLGPQISGGPPISAEMAIMPRGSGRSPAVARITVIR